MKSSTHSASQLPDAVMVARLYFVAWVDDKGSDHSGDRCPLQTSLADWVAFFGFL